MINRDSSGTTMTGEEILVFRVLTIRRGLILKIDTGMNLSRLSPLKAAQADGITSARTFRPALRDVNRWLVERGLSAKWSRKYPNG